MTPPPSPRRGGGGPGRDVPLDWTGGRGLCRGAQRARRGPASFRGPWLPPQSRPPSPPDTGFCLELRLMKISGLLVYLVLSILFLMSSAYQTCISRRAQGERPLSSGDL